MSSSQQSVLVFRSAALGDFVIASPALRMVRNTYPSCTVLFLTVTSMNKAVHESVARYSPEKSAPWLELVTPHLIDEAFLLDPTALFRSIFKLRKLLSRKNVSKAILLLDPAAPWPGRIKKLLLIWALVGFVPVHGWRAAGSLNSDRAALKRAGLLPHHVNGPMQFLAEQEPPIKYSTEDVVFDLRPTEASVVMAKRLLGDARLRGKRLVAIAPGSIQPHKRWPIKNFRELCAQLLAEFPDIAIVTIGTSSDLLLGDQLCELNPERCVNLAGASSIPVSAAVLAKCFLLVGNDGGAMHLGDAMGCRVVSIMPGIEYPGSIEPWNNKENSVRHQVDCAPCYSFQRCPLKHNKCMVELPVERVLRNCRQLLVGET